MSAASTTDSDRPRRPLGLPREARLRKGREFDRVFAQRTSGTGRNLRIHAATAPGHVTRLGMAVSRRNGNAVRRNRIRRRIREAFRISRPELPPGLDLVVVPRRGAADAPFEELREELVQTCRRLADRLAAAPAEGAAGDGAGGETGGARE